MQCLKTIESIATIFGGFATAIGLAFLVIQIRGQRKKEKLELVTSLFRDFYQNESFKRVFQLIDQEDVHSAGSTIDEILNKNAIIDTVQEIDFNAYLNFFNSLALLVEEGVIRREMVMRVFRYQLEKTYAIHPLISYSEQYGFNRVLKLLPDKFFFYGKLLNHSARRIIPEIKDVLDDLIDVKKSIQLKGFALEEVVADERYSGMVPSRIGGSIVSGGLVKINSTANWHRVFTTLDEYEEVPYLYERVIIEIPRQSMFWFPRKSKDYVWVYMKANKSNEY